MVINSLPTAYMIFSKKKALFKFDGSTSALTINSLSGGNDLKPRNKLLICSPDPNNIIYVFIPFMCFVEEIEHIMKLNQG